MPIEMSLYRSDPFRRTTVAFPFPLPLKQQEVEPEKKLSDALRAKVNEIMATHGITDLYTAEIYAMRKPDYPGGKEPAITLQIEFRSGKGLPYSWSEARDEAKRMLGRNGLKSVEVEIVDYERAFMPSLFPISPTSGAVTVYESIKDQLIKLLFKRLRNKWRLISLFNVARILEKGMPTIVVLVNPCVVHDWQQLELLCKDIIKKALLQGRELPVEFLPGNIGDTHDEGKDITSNYSVGPGLGASFGVVNGGGGTMGGYVDLETGGKVYNAILTSNHVIAPSRASTEEIQIACKGYRFSLTEENRPSCQVPHQLDYDASMLKIQGRIDEAREELAKNREKQEWKRTAGKPIPIGLADECEDLKEIESRSIDSKNRLQTLPVKVGKIMASSGVLINAKAKKLDWALVRYNKEMNPSSFSCGHVNRLPSAKFLNGIGKGPEDYGFKTSFLGDNLTARRFGEMEKGRWYLKVGRTTSITAGVCNGAVADVVRAVTPHYDEDGKEVKLEERTVEEYVVISYSTSEKGPRTQDGVCLPGDSGSFVINTKGEVSGLLYNFFAGKCGPVDYCNAGLVSCMTDVIPSIEKRTAWRDSKGKMRPGVLSLPRGS